MIALIGMALFVGRPARAQLPDTIRVSSSLGNYSDARAIGVDPEGRIYIADAGRHIVEVRDTDGKIVYELGGPGSEEGEFDEPSGVDPTNGLVIVVADAGNARIQRFTGRYQLIESIPLYSRGPDVLGSTIPSSARTRDDGIRSSNRGRPTSVAVSSTGETFAIDEANHVVAKWDGRRTYVGPIGSSINYDRLQEPVDLEIIDDLLFVADRGRKRIIVYDMFGSIVTEFGRLPELAALASRNGFLWVLHGNRVSVFTPSGTLAREFRLSAGTSYRDLAVTRDTLLLLTRSKLLRASVATGTRLDG